MKVVRTEANESYKKSLYIPSSDVVFIPIAKAASLSIKSPLLRMEHKYLTKDEVARLGCKKVAVVRNTYDRLISCYRFFTQKVPKSKYTLNIEFSTFDEFIREVCSTPDDISNSHFRSQFNTLSHDGCFLPDIVIDMDEIDKVLDHLPITDLQITNSTGIDHSRYYTDKLIDLVNIRFKKDIDYFSFKYRG